MKILITGNLGYVGANVIEVIRKDYPKAILIGFDAGFYSNCLATNQFNPSRNVDIQYFGDIRKFDSSLLIGVDKIVHLAAISNDPVGNLFKNVTIEINYLGTIQLAKMAKKAGVKSFVFASSCSVYGAAEDVARTEESPLDPLTPYARSKVLSEEGLYRIADRHFNVTCLRFSTACGFSERLRLDLVLNDFVAGAITNKKINILSDGTPWRPLIHVFDMGRAISWAVNRNKSSGHFLLLNVGSTGFTHQVKELALKVQKIIKGTKIVINKKAPPDKRSYKVDFKLFKKLAPDHQPIWTANKSISQLVKQMNPIKERLIDFPHSQFIRLNVLTDFIVMKKIDKSLIWKKQ